MASTHNAAIIEALAEEITPAALAAVPEHRGGVGGGNMGGGGNVGGGLGGGPTKAAGNTEPAKDNAELKAQTVPDLQRENNDLKAKLDAARAVIEAAAAELEGDLAAPTAAASAPSEPKGKKRSLSEDAASVAKKPRTAVQLGTELPPPPPPAQGMMRGSSAPTAPPSGRGVSS